MISDMIMEIEFGTPLYDSSVQLRDIILRRPLNLEFTQEQLASEYDSFHFAYLTKDYDMLGCLVMKPIDPDTVKMRQVAVRETSQKMGIGTALVAYAEKWAADRGFRQIELHARDKAIPFYLRLNYKKLGRPFKEVGITHYKMVKKL